MTEDLEGKNLELGEIEALGEQAQSVPTKAIGHALDRFMGTWTAEQEDELLRAVEIFECVDESFWL